MIALNNKAVSDIKGGMHKDAIQSLKSALQIIKQLESEQRHKVESEGAPSLFATANLVNSDVLCDDKSSSFGPFVMKPRKQEQTQEAEEEVYLLQMESLIVIFNMGLAYGLEATKYGSVDGCFNKKLLQKSAKLYELALQLLPPPGDNIIMSISFWNDVCRSHWDCKKAIDVLREALWEIFGLTCEHLSVCQTKSILVALR